jgi:hypothetical protein
MTSSGTTSFALSNASIAVAAYSRIQVRRTALLAEHMQDAYNEFNLMISSLSNLQPNLWKVDLVTVPMVAGQATYNVDADTIQIMDAYISTGSGVFQNDRLITGISRSDYASYANKLSEGTPTVYWFDRLIDPTITLWEVPNVSGIYTLKYYRVMQMDDANLRNGETPDIPYRFYDCMVAGLAHRLARIWKPELEQQRERDFDKAWAIAATQDTENVPMSILPQLGRYFA